MTDDRSLERAARSFIEPGPTRAPEAAVEAALVRIQTTTQERDWHVPWRTGPMTQTTRLLAGAAAIAVVLVGGVLLLRPSGNSVIGGPSPVLPSASPSSSGPSGSAQTPLALTRTFTSARHGFSVQYPEVWTVKPATRSWSAGQSNTWGSGINDELSSAAARFSGASQPLAAGQTSDAWMTAYANGSDTSSWLAVTIDGQPGKIDYDGGPAAGGTITPGGVMFDAVVVADKRAYNFNMDGKIDRATFDALLATVTLPVLPTLDKTFTSPLAGYSIDHPSDWAVTPAPKAWTTGYDTSSVSDRIGGATAIYGTSMNLPTGTSFATWYAAYDADRAKGTCGAAAAEEAVSVDGVAGRLDVHCPGFYIEAVVSKGGRVYVLTMYTPYSRPLFESLLGTVRLNPAGARN